PRAEGERRRGEGLAWREGGVAPASRDPHLYLQPAGITAEGVGSEVERCRHQPRGDRLAAEGHRRRDLAAPREGVEEREDEVVLAIGGGIIVEQPTLI